jgi:hypothetical protein
MPSSSADEEEEVDSPSIRAPTRSGVALSVSTLKLDVERRSVDASLAVACPCAESLSLLNLNLEDFDDDALV